MVGDFFCAGTESLEQELDNTIVIVIPMVLEIGISDSFLWGTGQGQRHALSSNSGHAPRFARCPEPFRASPPDNILVLRQSKARDKNKLIPNNI
jgi:hypothetical protein